MKPPDGTDLEPDPNPDRHFFEGIAGTFTQNAIFGNVAAISNAPLEKLMRKLGRQRYMQESACHNNIIIVASSSSGDCSSWTP